MKQPDYRLIVLLIIFTVSTAIAIRLGYKPHERSKAAIVINDTAISEKAFNRMFSKKPCLQSVDDFIRSVVVKEVLIQEAIKAGVHHEEAFRRSVQDFYEQSLIKVIMDRTYDSLTPTVDTTLVDRYVDLIGSTVDLTLRTYKTAEDIDSGRADSEEATRLPFNRLSIEVRYDLLQLTPGDTSSPAFSETDNVYSVFRLDAIHPDESRDVTADDRDLARQLIVEHQKELMISAWLDDLTSRATVAVGAGVGGTSPSDINDR